MAPDEVFTNTSKAIQTQMFQCLVYVSLTVISLYIIEIIFMLLALPCFSHEAGGSQNCCLQQCWACCP